MLMFEYGQPFGKKCHKVKEDEEEEVRKMKVETIIERYLKKRRPLTPS